MTKEGRWSALRREKNYTFGEMCEYLGVSKGVFWGLVSRGQAEHLFEKFQKAPAIPKPPRRKGGRHTPNISLDSVPATRNLLPQEGQVLRNGDKEARIVRVLGEHHIIADVRETPNGPWVRREWTMQPHNRLTDAGAWEG